MAIRKWLWPKLETTDDADRELRVVARGLFVWITAFALAAKRFLFDGGELFVGILFAAMVAYSAYVIYSRRSRVAAVFLAAVALNNAILLSRSDSYFSVSLFLLLTAVLFFSFCFLSVRAVRATFIYHRVSETRVVLRRAVALTVAICAYYLLWAFVVLTVSLGMEEGTALAEVAIAGAFCVLPLVVSRRLPGTGRIGPVAEFRESEYSSTEGRSAMAPESAVDSGEPSRDSYFLQHWRGEIDVTRSFWVNYVVFYVFVTAAIFGIAESAPFESFRGMAGFFATAYAVNLAAFTWMGVGNWRAAGTLLRTTGKRISFWAVRGTVILHAAVLVIVIVPYFVQMSVISLGLDPFNTYKVVRTDSHEVLVQGHLGGNLPGDIASVLDRSPEIEWIRFESEGGRIGAAREIAVMIRARGLKVRVWEKCLSACFVPLMAAEVRALSRKARIGLHGYFNTNGFGFAIAGEMERDRRFLTSRDVSETFLDKAFSTPPDDMWYPSFEELVAAGVVTHVMEGGEIRPVHPD